MLFETKLPFLYLSIRVSIGRYLTALISNLCTGPIEGVSVGLPKVIEREGEGPLRRIVGTDNPQENFNQINSKAEPIE